MTWTSKHRVRALRQKEISWMKMTSDSTCIMKFHQGASCRVERVNCSRFPAENCEIMQRPDVYL